MEPCDVLPATPLGAGPLADPFRAAGCADFRSAARLAWRLPYGRNEHPEDLLCVVREGRGTCSSKHVLLARLADEQRIPGIELRVALYEMTEANTPGVGATLARHGLASILEAHCFLVYRGTHVDLTRADAAPAETLAFISEHPMAPDDVLLRKPELHRRIMAEWCAAGRYGDRRLDDVWAIREECIAALAERESQSAAAKAD